MNDKEDNESKEAKIIRIDEEKVREHLDGVAREAVEETLNKLLEAEADALCGATRYERSAGRVDTRAGEVRLKAPKPRSLPFETAIIEHYQRRESSVEEALIEDVSGRRLRPPRRGHHRGAVRHEGEREPCERPE